MRLEANALRMGARPVKDRVTALLLGALLLGGCGSAPAAPPRSGPALWKVADADTTIYLFGTIHLLPEGTKWRTPAIAQAIAASDALVTEAVLGGDPAAGTAEMAQLAVSPGLPPLAERVPADKRAALQTMMKGAGLAPDALDHLETWAAALSLLSVSFGQMGLKPELGVERGLEAEARAAGKPVTGLETLAGQMRLFDGLSEDAQRAFLLSAIEDPAAGRAEFDTMVAAWIGGDLAEIARTFDEEMGTAPELRAALMTRRNAAWASWIAARLDQPGTLFMAVGAGHLAGRDSVQELLRARGLASTRIQ